MANTFYPLDRKKIRYADIVRAQAPEARKRYFDDQSIGLQRSALAQEQENFDKSLELQKEQMRINEEQAKVAAEQARRSQAIGTASVGVSAYPYVKKGVKGLYDLTFGSDGAAATEASPNPAPLTNESIINDVYTPEYPVEDFAAYPREQAVVDAISPPYETPEYSALVREGSRVPVSGAGESAIPGDQAVLDTIRPAYKTPGYENLISESSETPSYGAGEAAIPAATGVAGYTAGEEAVLGSFAPVYQTPGYEALVSEGASEIGGLGVGEAAVSSGAEGAAAGGGLSWWGGPVIVGATIGQQAAARYSDPVEGVAPGDFFSVEDGNWKPRFAEPDKNYFSQRWGGGPTTGAKFDARLQRGDLGGAAKALPGFAHGYAVPGLDVAGNVVGGYVSRQVGDKSGKAVQSMIDPVGYATSTVADAKDLGDLGGLAGMAGIPGDPVSAIFSAVGGGGSGSDVLRTIATGGFSHFCTAITKSVGMSKVHTAMMNILRNWSVENRKDKAIHYFRYGGEVVNKIRESFKTSDEEKVFFEKLKQEMVFETLLLMAADRIEDAFNHYWNKYLELTKEYTPEFYPGYAKAEMPGD